MGILGKWFSRKDAPTPTARVRGLMGGFIEACFITIDGKSRQKSSDGRLMLLFMLGAIDMLCQVHEIDEKASLALFESMLQAELGGYTPAQARAVLVEVVRATTDSDGKRLMHEGAESIREWLTGISPLAPHRLSELLSEHDASHTR